MKTRGMREARATRVPRAPHAPLVKKAASHSPIIGAYGGYRVVRYNELEVEGEVLEPAFGSYDTDNVGDTWFAGLRLTWTFTSEWQDKQNTKL